MANRKTLARQNSREEEVAAVMPPEAGSGDGTGRHRRIEEAAYLRAAARGFMGGDPVEDWLLAETEIDAADAAAKRRLLPIAPPWAISISARAGNGW